MTADLTPGFLIQAPATLTYVPELHRRAVVELKIEVMWGRATVAFLVIDDHNGNPNKRFSKIYRGAHGEGAERPYNASDPVHAFHEGFEFGSLHWIFTEGHMPCAWALAERVAHAMAADQVRVDVFVAESRPTQCLVNEISLSSGNPSGTADRHLAALWIEPIVTKKMRAMPFEPRRGYEMSTFASEGAYCLMDGSVVENGARLPSTIPCGVGSPGPQKNSTCEAMVLLSEISRAEKTRSDIRLVIVRCPPPAFFCVSTQRRNHVFELRLAPAHVRSFCHTVCAGVPTKTSRGLIHMLTCATLSRVLRPVESRRPTCSTSSITMMTWRIAPSSCMGAAPHAASDMIV